jgi:hypothetical protein
MRGNLLKSNTRAYKDPWVKALTLSPKSLGNVSANLHLLKLCQGDGILAVAKAFAFGGEKRGGY